MLSIDQDDFERIEAVLKRTLASRLKGLNLQSMSVVDSRVNLQYQYRQQPSLDWTALVGELNQRTAPAKVDIFVG
jgi:hypothetical protein